MKEKKKASFSFDPHVFWWKTCCHWKSFSLRDKVFVFSCCFQDFFFTSNFWKFNYYMSWHRFLWVYLVWNVLSILNLQLYLSLAESGKFSAIISLSTFQPLPLSPLLRLMAWMLDLLFLRHFSFFFFGLFFLCSSDWVISTVLFSSSLILFSLELSNKLNVSHSAMSDSGTPWTVARQASLSMEFYRQGFWVGSHSLLQEIFLTQGLNPGLPLCRQILHHLSHQEAMVKQLLSESFLFY